MKIKLARATLKVLLTVLVLINNTTEVVGQTTINYKPLKSFDPNDNLDDLAALDTFFSKSKIVGMGESTHGTHEFFQNRHRVFRYLVENHGFNVFFLEADYSNCLRVNRYIQGEKDDLRAVVKSIALWPWVTEEMAALIKWMRAYNLTIKSPNKLQFIGCDMQMINSTISEINYLVTSHGSTLIDSSKYIRYTEKEFFELSEDEIIDNYKPVVTRSKDLLTTLQFDNEDRYIYQTLIRQLEQIIEYGIKSKFRYYRDIKMGENILYHLENNSSIKGFYWAHNMHVANYYFPNKKENLGVYRAGGVLKNKLREEYFIIGQDFDQGTFNAYYVPGYNHDKKIDLTDIQNFVLGPVQLGLNKNELGYQFKNTPDAILYVTTSAFGKKENLLYLHDAGSYYIPPKKLKHPSITTAGPNSFDIIIIIKNTTETQLIKDD